MSAVSHEPVYTLFFFFLDCYFCILINHAKVSDALRGGRRPRTCFLNSFNMCNMKNNITITTDNLYMRTQFKPIKLNDDQPNYKFT